MNNKVNVKWLTKKGIRSLKDFEKFFVHGDFFKYLNEYLDQNLFRLTIYAYLRLRSLWSGELLNVRTGRMLGSLKMKIRKGRKYSIGKIWSDRLSFLNTYYYPLTHEAFNRPYTIILPKNKPYILIPPNPEKGYNHWTRARQVLIPKRPAFQIVVEELRSKKIPKNIKNVRNYAIKLFGRGGK